MSQTSPENPLVTIILVTANRADWLEEPINAILAQHETNFELILVDCNSADDTASVLEAFARDERVHFEQLEETDKGVARRLALKKARGKFVIFPDPHCIWQPGLLQGLLACLDWSPESTGVAYALGNLVNEDGTPVKTVPREPPHGGVAPVLFERPCIALGGVLVRWRAIKPLQKQGNRFWLGNDHALLLWLAGETAFEPAPEPLMTLRPIEGAQPPGLDPVAELRGDAMTRVLETFPGVVRARYARRCLSSFWGLRAEALRGAGAMGEAFACSLRSLMYRPLWITAWKRILRIAAGR